MSHMKHIIPIRLIESGFSPDLCGSAGAALIKQRLEAYWRERGYAVQARVERLTVAMAARGEAYAVKTNLVNGWPNP